MLDFTPTFQQFFVIRIGDMSLHGAEINQVAELLVRGLGDRLWRWAILITLAWSCAAVAQEWRLGEQSLEGRIGSHSTVVPLNDYTTLRLRLEGTNFEDLDFPSTATERQKFWHRLEGLLPTAAAVPLYQIRHRNRAERCEFPSKLKPLCDTQIGQQSSFALLDWTSGGTPTTERFSGSQVVDHIEAGISYLADGGVYWSTTVDGMEVGFHCLKTLRVRLCETTTRVLKDVGITAVFFVDAIPDESARGAFADLLFSVTKGYLKDNTHSRWPAREGAPLRGSNR